MVTMVSFNYYYFDYFYKYFYIASLLTYSIKFTNIDRNLYQYILYIYIIRENICSFKQSCYQIFSINYDESTKF